MRIQNLFEKDIFRPINGVVKADQLDESSVCVNVGRKSGHDVGATTGHWC